MTTLKALIADDERLLREQLRARLADVWPELEIVGQARDGLEAVRLAEELRPDIVFLDIRMPGQTGLEAAGEIVNLDNWSGEMVFVTAYDEYAVTAFEKGAIDYLLKPVESERLHVTRKRLEERLRAKSTQPAGASDMSTDTMMQTLQQVQRQLQSTAQVPKLRWLQASAGQVTRMIDVDEVLFFRSDEKYTRVQTRTQEALIRVPIKDLMPQLDEERFWQIHRSTIVNVGQIASIHKDETGRQKVLLKDFPEQLEVSRSYGHLFRNQ